jgi:hypothetical protein
MRKINIKKDRKEIAKIIRVNMPLMNANPRMCSEVADCIIAYLIGALEEHK